jgi:hypothetical protein
MFLKITLNFINISLKDGQLLELFLDFVRLEKNPDFSKRWHLKLFLIIADQLKQTSN